MTKYAKLMQDLIDDAVSDERKRCIRAISDWPGLTEDEKRIAIMAIGRQC